MNFKAVAPCTKEAFLGRHVVGEDGQTGDCKWEKRSMAIALHKQAVRD